MEIFKHQTVTYLLKMSEDEKAVSEILGGKRDMESFNEDFELTTLLKRYLSDQTEENLKIHLFVFLLILYPDFFSLHDSVYYL